MTKPKVFLTRKWPRKAEEAIGEIFDVTLNKNDVRLSKLEIAKAFAVNDAIAPTFGDVIDKSVIEYGFKGQGKIISNFGVGVDHIDIETCKKFNIPVTNTPDVLTDATAEISILLMLMVARRALEGEKQIRENIWSGWHPTHLMGSLVNGKTLGIIGMGRIGQEVAKKAFHAFKMKIVFYNRSKIKKDLGFPIKQVSSVTELCRESDFVSIHCPGGKETFNILNAEAIANLKKSSFIINTARGDVLDEEAVFNALSKGLIAGAGLDVYKGEPIINKKILNAPNTVLLPHLGSATYETRTSMGMKVLDNLKAFFNNTKPIDMVY
tara:strand:+ start:1150 stop:2118 length:969 start_codon:yes stop_codon:yes gene_type:complete